MRQLRARPDWRWRSRLIRAPEPSHLVPGEVNATEQELEEYALMSMSEEDWTGLQGRMWSRAVARGEAVVTGNPAIDAYERARVAKQRGG